MSPFVRKLVLFTLIVCAFALLVYRTEKTDHEIRQNNYRMCQARNHNVARANAFNAGMIEIERRNPFVTTSPGTINDRIRLYQDAHLQPVDCSPWK